VGKDDAKPVNCDSYRFHTRRPLNNLVFILPMLAAYHLGAIIYGTNLLAPHHLKGALEYFGATASFLPASVVILVLLVQHFARRDEWKLQSQALAGMLVESVAWMIPLIAMGLLMGRLQAATEVRPDVIGHDILEAFGAGIYEEFLFRLMFISLSLLIFVDIFSLREDVITIAAIILGALVFSLYHLSADQLSHGSQLPWAKIVSRTLAGIYLGTLFVHRGFGIAVGTHAFYNIYTVVAKLQ